MKPDFPLPDCNDALSGGFWQGAARGELALPRCAACGRWNWYPLERCLECQGSEMPWTATSGRGSLFSWAVVERAWVKPFEAWAPYVTGLVALEEDPRVRIVSRIVDCAPDALCIDQSMHVVFRPLGLSPTSRDVVAPLFTPDGPAVGQE